MNILEKIKGNRNIKKNLSDICQFRIYDKYVKANNNKYVFLDNGTVGLISYGSVHIEGIVAENLTDLFSLIIKNSGFIDFMIYELFNELYEDLFFEKNSVLLKNLCEALEDKNLLNLKSETLKMLDIPEENNTMRKFYKAVKRGIAEGYNNPNAGNIMIYPFVPDCETGVFTIEDWVNNWILDMNETENMGII